MLALALPSCIASLTFISGMLALVFIGPYGTDAIAGAGLGFMWTNGELPRRLVQAARTDAAFAALLLSPALLPLLAPPATH